MQAVNRPSACSTMCCSHCIHCGHPCTGRAFQTYAHPSALHRMRAAAGALPEEAIAQQRLLFGAIAHAARRLAHAHATTAARQRAMAEEAEAAAVEELADAAAAADPTAPPASKGGGGVKQPKRRKGRRAGHTRSPTISSELEKEEEAEKEPEAVELVVNPSDMVVYTEHMLGALQALLPG